MTAPGYRISLLWPTLESYHLARLRSLHERLGSRVMGLEFVDRGGDDNTGAWRPDPGHSLPIQTVMPGRSMVDVDRGELGAAIIDKLTDLAPDIIFLNGYSTKELRMVIRWAKANKKHCFTFFESKTDDFRRYEIVEWVKRWILRDVDGAICGGEAHKRYATSLGLPASKVVLGYDVVDNSYYERTATEVLGSSAHDMIDPKAPRKYFLSVSRFVEKKNLAGLLTAYKAYRSMPGAEPWGLVLCGSGPLNQSLRDQVVADSIPDVFFPGVIMGRQLVAYYAHASALVLASTTEQWGLVVNEAMAAGVPVIVSKAAGSASELVIDEDTGLTIDPNNTRQIAETLSKMVRMSESERTAMALRGRRRVNDRCPLSAFADGVIRLCESVV